MKESIDTFDIKYLKGIGDKRAKILAEGLGGSSLRHLLYYFPYRYVDRSRFYSIADLRDEMPMVQIRGSFINFAEEGEGHKRRLKGLFSDGHKLMEVVWFSGIDYMRRTLERGKEYVIFGKPTNFNGSFSMPHPEIETYDPGKPPVGMQGVYPMTDQMRRQGISQKVFKKALASLVEKPAFASMSESLPQEMVESFHLMPLRDALLQMHFPTDADSLSRARQRLKFEELFYLELNILRFARRRDSSTPGLYLPRVGDFFNRFFSDVLPFPLTGAQKRVLREIRNDMRTGRQMNRLLQGDVGSGKTMVAFMTMLLAVDNGMQAAIMAPTEILASQHYATLSGWCDELGLSVRLLTGTTRAAERREILAGLADGTINMAVGTHALLEEKVIFKNLAVAVIDEQHRFGVAQRSRMWKKNVIPPHVLVMTATPIPRTLAMTVYGDLEVSVIDELPPGRKPVSTMLCFDDRRQEFYNLMGRELRAGRQAYVVYPLIHENEKLSLKSVEQGFERICSLFPGYQVSMVHGQLPPDKKEREMQKFVTGESRILVATTVIEVGVNVPNASVMIIEDAERFGLSQLHQLRGRVGRGADHSYCVLVAKPKMGADTRKRLSVMAETSDGFVLSEADMKLRGPGDMEGTQQSGLAFHLQVADLARDGQILKVARDAASSILAAHPDLYGVAVDPDSKTCPPLLAPPSVALVNEELSRRFARVVDWSRIS